MLTAIYIMVIECKAFCRANIPSIMFVRWPKCLHLWIYIQLNMIWYAPIVNTSYDGFCFCFVAKRIGFAILSEMRFAFHSTNEMGLVWQFDKILTAARMWLLNERYIQNMKTNQR